MVVSFAIILGLLPSFAWLIFFLKEDLHPEPKRMIALVFFAGAISTFFALAFQFYLRDILNSLQISQYSIWAFLVFGFTEEIFKFCAAYIVIKKSPYFDEPIDAMIYMITAALGFALVENIAIMLSAQTMSDAFNVITMRFVGATLLHALSSGIVGYYWAKSIAIQKNSSVFAESKSPEGLSTNKSKKLYGLWLGFILATLLHAVFNYLILISNESIIYPIIFLTIAALFVFWDFERIKASD